MTRPADQDETSHDGPIDSLTDPATLHERADVPVTSHTVEHEGLDHCSTDIAGRIAVGVTDADDQLLLLCNDELGIALLPHGTVDGGEDWAAVARREIEGQTGIEIVLDDVKHVREIDHVLEGESDPHASNDGIVFGGSPTGGEIQECKRSAEAGSDGWRAGWFDGLPAGIEQPKGGPGKDLELFR
ncbi:NUDIX hydrolase [Salinarchaeum laminariae]|uniref:NUDIX hydrolase n=1 Tax=Salinarchaeum laminariae TaxID=869888 RepID=UPI0020C05AD4|nr:NUDIX domain-containing protein [Salinarchaeum laminariae]